MDTTINQTSTTTKTSKLSLYSFVTMGLSAVVAVGAIDVTDQLMKRAFMPVSEAQAQECVTQIRTAELKYFLNATDPFEQFAAQTCVVQINRYVDNNADKTVDQRITAMRDRYAQPSNSVKNKI